MHETMPQLDVSTFPSQIFWLVVCFGVLCFAMATFLVPRIAKTLAARQEELVNLKIKADKIFEEANRLQHDNQKNFDGARQDASIKMHKMTLELNRLHDQHLASLEQKTQGILSKIQQSLNEQKLSITSEMNRLLTHLSSDVFQRITRRKIDENKLEQCVQLVQDKTHKNRSQ